MMMYSMTIKDFCIKNNIDWFPICLELIEGIDGKIEKNYRI